MSEQRPVKSGNLRWVVDSRILLACSVELFSPFFSFFFNSLFTCSSPKNIVPKNISLKFYWEIRTFPACKFAKIGTKTSDQKKELKTFCRMRFAFLIPSVRDQWHTTCIFYSAFVLSFSPIKTSTLYMMMMRTQPSFTGFAYYRKRGSASYIVRSVRSVRERERERERGTETDGSDVTIVALKLAMRLHLGVIS